MRLGAKQQYINLNSPAYLKEWSTLVFLKIHVNAALRIIDQEFPESFLIAAIPDLL
mgnify:CR=1 FL=1